MARQTSLLPDPKTELNVQHREPLLWVRRISVWAQPGELLRDIRLRRGLNVVWSPDPGASGAMLGGTSRSGHGAGKSLLCRLIRYCLGEESFAAADLRQSVAEAFPEGTVGAEVVVRGTTWSVVRPIGANRRIVAVEGELDGVVADDLHGTGMRPLLDAIDGSVAASPGGESATDSSTWLTKLAWLSRDQECRFGHMLEWRHPTSESRSPVASLSKDERLMRVRAFVGAMPTDEFTIRQRVRALELQIQSSERDEQNLRWGVTRLATSLTARLDLPNLGHDEVFVHTARAKVRAQQDAATADLEIARGATTLLALRQQLESVIGESAVLEREVDHAGALIELHTMEQGQLRGQHAQLSAEGIKARLGPTCPVCLVPIDEALARGCGLVPEPFDPHVLRAEQQNVQAQLAAVAATKREYERQRDEKQGILEGRRKRAGEIRAAIAAEEHQSRGAELALLLPVRRLEEDIGALERLQTELEDVRAALRTQRADLDRANERSEKLREAAAAPLERYDALFGYVSRALLGEGAEASLRFEADRLRARVRVGGTAMESLKAIAFDVAAMLMAIEGRAQLPAFLIHDSPREADMGISHYHRLFRFMQQLESLGTPPPFQYIVTTTTEPPTELQTTAFVVAQLSGTDELERLLRKTL
jgi:hypothetical protein